jgi:hypothetical protein
MKWVAKGVAASGLVSFECGLRADWNLRRDLAKVF